MYSFNMKRNTILFALIIMLTASLPSCSKQKTSGSSTKQQTQASTAPDFSLTLSTGEAVRLSDYQGKAVLLHFWATWCPPCRAELPELNKLAAELAESPDSKFEFLAVCVSDEEASRVKFMSQNGYSFKGGLDASGEIASLYRVQGIPCSFIISPDGKIEKRHVGAMNKAQLAAFVSGYYDE